MSPLPQLCVHSQSPARNIAPHIPSDNCEQGCFLLVAGTLVTAHAVQFPIEQ
jgi:hypothetical protein